jgi:hypothetical protein
MKSSLDLRIAKSSFHQALWVVFFVLFFLFAFELLVKNRHVKAILPYPSPSVNSEFPDLDIKFDRQKNQQKVDCLFIGSSMVMSGLDPRVFEHTLIELGDQKYTCLNMGFSGSMVETTGAVAKSLINWQPIKLVIWGLSPIEMDKYYVRTRPIAQMPVFTYNESKPSIEGWLYNSFDLPWYFLAIPHTLNPVYKKNLIYWDKYTDDRGVRVVHTYGNLESGWNDTTVRDFKINPVDMNVLQSTISTFKDRHIQVVAVEMPVYTEFFPYLVEGGEAVYEREFIKPLEEYFHSEGISFIRTQPIIQQIVGKRDWIDLNHLNFSGGAKFSTFIAQKIYNEGLIK